MSCTIGGLVWVNGRLQGEVLLITLLLPLVGFLEGSIHLIFLSQEREKEQPEIEFISLTHIRVSPTPLHTHTHTLLAATRGSVPRVITDVNLRTWNPLAVARWYISEKRLLFLLSSCKWLSFLFFLYYADHFPACRQECVKENRLTGEKSYDSYEEGGSSLAHFYHIWKERKMLTLNFFFQRSFMDQSAAY